MNENTKRFKVGDKIVYIPPKSYIRVIQFEGTIFMYPWQVYEIKHVQSIAGILEKKEYDRYFIDLGRRLSDGTPNLSFFAETSNVWKYCFLLDDLISEGF